MKFSIVIPAYNEESRIEKTINKILAYLNSKKWDFNIVVVDDGSTDKTGEIVSKFRNSQIEIVKNQKNMGKGYSVKRGALASQGDWTIFTDADLSTPIEELEKFMQFQDYDVLIGSRALKESKILVHQPFYRELSGKIFNLFVKLLVIRDIHDTQCGFKLFKREAAKEIFKRQTLNGFSFDVETIYIARKMGYRIKEIPIRWFNDKETKVKFVRSSLQMLIDLFKIRLNDIKGLYQ